MIRSALLLLMSARRHVSYLKQKTIFSSGTDMNMMTRSLSNSNNFTSSCFNISILDHHVDKYRSAVLDPSKLPSNTTEFLERLKVSIEFWEKESLKAVWLRIPVEFVQLIEPAIKLGFQFHHAMESHVMLTKWMLSTPCTLPPFASHQIGVGAIIRRNLKNEILVVQERSGPLSGTGVWKLPTGLVDSREDIKDAAIREAFEETGVTATFRGIVAFRQAHNMSFGVSDLYFLCLLEATSDEINFDNKEISACRWLSIDEYRNQPFYSNSPAYAHQVAVIADIVQGNNEGRVFRVTDFTAGFIPSRHSWFYVDPSNKSV